MLGELYKPQFIDGEEVIFLFSNYTGEPCIVENIGLTWRYFLKCTGFPYLNFHGLRHTCATMLIQNGIDMHIVQKIMRHADVSMTINRYTHTEISDLQIAAKILDEIL